jgi:hypothetical protein
MLLALDDKRREHLKNEEGPAVMRADPSKGNPQQCPARTTAMDLPINGSPSSPSKQDERDEIRAPHGVLAWRSSAERNKLLKLWRRAVCTVFGEQTRCLRVAWLLDELFNAKTGYAYAGNKYLADETGIAENKVRATLLILEQGGAIVRRTISRNGVPQRVIYPAAALIPRPTVGQGGSPSSRGTIT